MFHLFIDEDKKKKNHFIVKNNSGKILYLIEGYWGRKDDTIRLFNLKKEFILQAKQVNLSPFFQFNIFQRGQKIASFRKHPGFFGLRDAFFTLQPNDWLIEGNFEKVNFIAFKNNQKIIKINKLLSHANYLYSLKVKNKNDFALASLLSILLDHYSRKKIKSNEFGKNFEKNYRLGLMNYQIHSKLYHKKRKLKNS